MFHFVIYALLHHRRASIPASFADAELAEDEGEDVVAGGGAGESVESVEGFVEVGEDHLVRDGVGCGLLGAGQGCCCGGDGLLLAEIGEESGVGGGSDRGDVGEDGGAEFGEACSGQGGGFYCCVGGLFRQG